MQRYCRIECVNESFLHERVRKQIRIGPVTKLLGSDCSDVQLVAVEEAEKIVVTKQIVVMPS